MKKEIYEDDSDVVEFLREVIQHHSGRGAYNVIMAKYNSVLQCKIIEMTSFFDCEEFSFVSMKTRIYVLANNMSIDDFPRCCTCGEIIKQNVASLHRGFVYHACSVKCAANKKGRTQRIKATKLRRHGDPNYNNGSQISETLKNMSLEEREIITQKCRNTRSKHKAEDPYFQDKIDARSKRTRLEKYGDENWNNSSQISATKRRKKDEDPEYYVQQVMRGKATRLERYGDENFNNREKDKQTRLERYGDENWNNREQASATCLERYGVDNPAKAECVKQQIRQTCIETYGASCFLASEQHKHHSAQVCLERYGVEHPMQSEAIRRKAIQSKNAKLYDTVVNSDGEVDLLSSKDEFITRNELTQLKWRCKKCGKVFYARPSFQWRRQGANWARCIDCYPLNSNCSAKQIEMFQFIKSICPDDDIIFNDRSAIHPYEIDVFNKTKMIGFEFDGLYWHSELAGCRKSLMVKTNMCNSAGVQLVHVLEDEWDLRKEQCKAKIREVLGVYDPVCSKFKVCRASREYAQAFLDSNCCDIFARASAFNFAAVSDAGKMLATIGVSVFDGIVTFHNMCCSVDCVNLDVVDSIVDHVIREYGRTMCFQAKVDGRWSSMLNRFDVCSHSQPSKWTVDCSKWLRTGICRSAAKQSSDVTYITDCGQTTYVLKML